MRRRIGAALTVPCRTGTAIPDRCPGIKKADLGPAVFANTITLTGCPGRARLHPGYRSYFFFDFLAFFAFFAFFAFLAIASSFELMD